MARALTASEATALLIERLGFDSLSDKIYFIKDNDFTRRYGVSDFKWVNPDGNRCPFLHLHL